MPGERFFDTNVRSYAFAAGDRRSSRAEALLAEGGVIGVQVLREASLSTESSLAVRLPDGHKISNRLTEPSRNIYKTSDSITVAWLTVIAGCTGLFAPRHGTMFVIALLCVCTISGTIFLVMSMYNPFNGPLKLSAAPLLQALQVLEQP